MATHLFQDLPLVMRKHVEQLHDMVNAVMQRAALAAGDSAARETPVDTGVARSNWVMTLDAPFSGLLPAYVPYPSYRMNGHEAVREIVIRTKGRSSSGYRPPSFHPSAYSQYAGP
jgi:hypothetical protein